MVAIVDYGMGNLRSVCKALEYLGHKAEITRDAATIRAADRLILPGVGAFGAAMENLRKYGLVDVLLDYCESGKPFLGICLGMQLLMEESEERGVHRGLGIIPGKVVRFVEVSETDLNAPRLKIPHMGWNSLSIKKNLSLLAGVDEGAMVYFVHSYYVCPPQDVVAATTNHGTEFCSVMAKDNVFGTQFHPEKSGAVGLRILANFVENV